MGTSRFEKRLKDKPSCYLYLLPSHCQALTKEEEEFHDWAFELHAAFDMDEDGFLTFEDVNRMFRIPGLVPLSFDTFEKQCRLQGLGAKTGVNCRGLCNIMHGMPDPKDKQKRVSLWAKVVSETRLCFPDYDADKDGHLNLSEFQ